MKVICAPDSFKETLSAIEAAEAMATGIRSVDPRIDCDVCPVADGGEGTMETLIAAMNGRILKATVTGPFGKSIVAQYGIVDEARLGIVELAQASGLALIPPANRNPMKTTTFGTGELIRHAMNHGCETVIVCLGGSATVDGATGIAQAVGARFFDENGELVTKPMNGSMLKNISRFEQMESEIAKLRIACDVTNPLCGENGAAFVYGPQKGATPEQVSILDQCLAHLANIVGGDPEMPGAGSAGGAGFGLVTMCGGKLERGIDLVLDAIKFRDRCRDASLVLTGEGRLDDQSLSGKATMGVARHASECGVKTIAIVGDTRAGFERCVGSVSDGLLTRVVSLSELFSSNDALQKPAKHLQLAAAQVARGELKSLQGSSIDQSHSTETPGNGR